jgi:spore coat protein U-like protein
MNLRNILLSAIAISAVATAASAQVSATGTATTDARIIQPLSIASAGALNFGTLTRPTAASVVKVTTANARSVTSGDTALVGSTSAVPTFTVSGEGAATYTLSAADFTLAGPGGATASVTPALSITTGALGGSAGTVGTQTFTVGGDLSLAANQAIGAYTGTLSVTVAYN